MVSAAGRGGWRRRLFGGGAHRRTHLPGTRARARRRRQPPFWERKTLAEMTHAEWESLCDGCGRCCVLKLENADTGEVHPTSVVCRLLDHDTCRCRNYKDRHALVSDCMPLNPDSLPSMRWLPKSCAYRRVHEGRGLAWWHPLVSGDPQTVVQAGISVRGNIVSEDHVHPDEALDRYVVRWVDAAEQPPANE